ncbi:uncharacterized protein [Coffea arabica]|uniref:Reverse transcriptase domain-containing protein n=1 Tax=Coffea arabica TaxID=13443 RepID=A0A6P6V2V3_COFAR|nr:uncharacterized protein LOC113716090 [Coffea arabica]
MRVQVWNCQSVGSPLTIPQLREVNNLFSPSMVFLSETKNRTKYMEKVKNILRFDEMVVVEAMNKAGGMALLWKDEVKILEVLTTAFTIEAHVEDAEVNSDWWFIGIYASCDNQIRKQQWQVIERLKRLWGERWLIAGDFNDIVSNEEKWGGSSRLESSFQDFKQFINGNHLLDIGFVGHPWTWSNNWEQGGDIKQRLDRGLCSYPWSQVYEKIHCTHIASYASDHSILLFDTMMNIGRRKKRFYFDKRWLKRDDIGEVVRSAWENEFNGSRMFQVVMKIKNCRVALLKWRNNFQANSQKDIEQIKNQLSVVQQLQGSTSMGSMGRRRRNRLNKLQREDGTWTESEEAVSTEVAKYYRKLLHSSDVGDLTEGIPHTISDELNGNLMKPVLEEEIKYVIFSMNPDKAAGVDGHLLKSVNHTVITLIPKVLNPTSLKHFRPVSLCTTMYKVIAKILANRLKCVLHSCICKNQSAFIPGRRILDSIMVSHEYLHYLNNKRHGKDGFMAVKLDMSKAYDRVEWSFLEAIMQKMGFHHKWRTWIMECVRSVSYSFNINGEVKEYAAETRKISGMKISRHGPCITHLFFADNSLIFCKANKDQATELMRVLQVYALGSGQLINLDKSSILFSKNVSPHVKHEICQVMGNMQSVTQGKYLGLPMVVARSKQQIFGFVKSNIKQRMSKWNNRFLSSAGKEVMLKSVALTMPTYTMSCFKLPSRLCKDLSSLMSNYWWGEANGKNKIHWCSWRKLTQSKNMGGLGFKDLMAFNAALLGKQVWRLITVPNLLVSQVMKAKYFPSTSTFRCKVPNNAFWLWRSLMGARELVNLGTRRKIGNGMNTNIWEDSWIPGNLNGRVTTTRDMDNGLHKVHELICHKTWNTNLVFKIFNPQDAERILATPISLAGKEDRHFWIYGTDGNYSVSSGYKLQVGHEERKHNRIKKETSTSWEDQTQRLWKDLWELKVKHK